MADASRYQKLDHKDHVLKMPGMYIGSVEPEMSMIWVFDQGTSKMVRRDVRYVPGLYKIADEIIMNAVDHSVRLKRQRSNSQTINPLKRICVAVDRETGVITVENDGDGIPVQPHPEHKVYVPELIFGHMLTSANYDATEERTIGGQNGIGAKACNIYSKWFEVETVDATRKKVYTQRFEDNMSVALPPNIRACAKKPYTRITFLPDYARFGLPDGLDDDMHALILRRVYDITAVTDPDVTVVLNLEKIACKSFERYCDMYLGARGVSERVYESIADGWEVVVALSDGGGLQQISFVNGVATLKGGRHLDHLVNIICKRLMDLIESRRKGLTVKRQFLVDSLFVFLRATVPNPSFDSQSKETLTTPVAKLGVKLELSDKFIDRVYKLDGLIDRVVSLSNVATEKGMKKTDGTKRTTINGIPKLDDAEWAGTAKSEQCVLILTEGDSAKAMAIAGLSSVGRQKYGVYPLRGKVLNVCDVPAQRIADNAEIANLKKIMGLQTGRVYEAVGDLRYGRIMILADADTDGSHIKGLVMNLFAQQWSSLLRVPGFLCSMLTPIVKARNTKHELSFYSAAEFQAWKSTVSPNTWKFKYYKGLGTSTAQEAKVYFKEMKLVSYVWDERSRDAMDLAFNKKRANDRKTWLGSYDASVSLDSVLDTTVTFADFVDKDLIHFSSYDIQRSIPSVVDGLKVSQRKVMFSCFKRSLREEIRVAQLAGYVSEHAAYHHGEASLHGTIVGLAQDFVGSNNVNLLEPVGQFGSRLAGGEDSASPRYIHTHLAKVARLMFPAEDDAILKYLDDDGTAVEPEWYLPVIPMILVNGATGIGTGYSTSIPCYNPKDIVAALRSLAAGAVLADECHPWYRGFKGSMRMILGRLCSIGTSSRVGANKMRIQELPVGTWTDTFKETLESFVEKNSDVKGYTNDSTDTAVDFTVTFADGKAVDRWLTKDNDSITKFETDLKLVSNKGLSTTNMHLFDAEGRIKKYANVTEIIEDFYHTRLAGYERRRTRQIETLSHQALVLNEKVRFLDMVIDGTIHLHTMTSESGLERFALTMFDGSYRYLTSMPMSSMSTDKKFSLEQDLVKTRSAIDRLQGTDAKSMWMSDLDALMVV